MGILLTGGSGFLGANLVRALAGRGIRPRLLLRGGSDRRGLAGLPYDEALGDVLDPPSLARALEGIHTVHHLAGPARFGPGQAELLRRVHVDGTRNLLEAARRAGVTRVVHVSAASAIGHGPRSAPADEHAVTDLPAGPYRQAKRDAEALASEANRAGFSVVIANPAFAIGAYDSRHSTGWLLLQIARGLRRLYPPGGTTFVNAADVAEGLVLLAERGRAGERYVLGGQDLTYRELFTLCAQECGAPLPLLPVGASALRAASRLAQLVSRASPRAGLLLDRALLEDGALAAYVSSQKAMRELGYRPRPLRYGVREAYRWFQEQGDLPRDRALTPTEA